MPREVIAWIDHDQRPDLLLLNADCFTTEQEEAISAALAEQQCTPRQVLNSFVAGEG
ncbi:hypothetical protein [Actinacidiphila sp. ITFR-21]|uniref:hypothetical protein n=1 Tax=Actinacidiphila sp. ITFR-21 TaxID=3075199 RepID=UPI00288B8739|nr:hypothetical protein [Streptomyces sp. ITFR-21]WNI20312.1 hypothetical protein RLT57_33125 [Streptomyces sp. ITFR-21]